MEVNITRDMVYAIPIGLSIGGGARGGGSPPPAGTIENYQRDYGDYIHRD
jgi:hypothetical protein